MADDDAQLPAGMEPAEPRKERVRRHQRRGRLYASALAIVALLVIVVAFAVDNAHDVKLGWVFGSSHLSLVWIIVVAVISGWLLGIATSFFFRHRTRRRQTADVDDH